MSVVGPATSQGEDEARLFDAIRAARVGGGFWAMPAEHVSRVLLVPATRGQAVAMWEALGDAERAESAWLGRVPVGLRGVAAGADVDPWSLLQPGVSVHVDAGHELAALAILAGLAPRLYGQGRFGSTAAVAHHLIAEVGYRDPFTGAPCPVGAAVALLGEWRRVIDANRGVAVVAGIAGWKRQAIRHLLWAPRPAPLAFMRHPDRAVRRARSSHGSIVAWPSRVSPNLFDGAANANVPVARIEDGFIRSVGLGSALHLPQSVVLDARGIYYDPTGPSDLEHLLATARFTPALLARARALRAHIVVGKVSKYGAGEGRPAIPARSLRRQLVLVPGQVSDDLSVLRGGGSAGTGMAGLLERVRAMEPDAEIWFRPHPDVDGGFRQGRIPDREALRFADRVIRGGGMAELLGHVDRVHVLTSLTGFEALLRDVEVTVHGLPFYAGWGLTRDLVAVPKRRGRRLALDELVAATLILYPRYLDPVTGLPCTAEVVTARFADRPLPRGTWLTWLRAVQGGIARHARDFRS